jgi:histidinol phosphatase-like enzyme (inositol monophosphatase family)
MSKPVSIPDFLDDLAFLSGNAILPFFRTQNRVSDKRSEGSFDPVTEADRAAELVIRNAIRATFPEHGIHGEEFDDHNAEAEFVWVIDPIDGTRAFICGLPVWGTLIGLTRRGVPAYGLMNQPYTRERFVGDGKTARLFGPTGERRLQTRSCEALSDAYLMTTTPYLFKEESKDRYLAVENQVKLARYGADCYAYAMLAAGQIDLVIETGLKTVDIVPLVPIIEGAGGIITTWEGGPVREGGSVIAAGDKRVHAAALHHLRL